jgi:protein TonB
MHYIQSTFKSFAAIILIVATITACNSNQSADSISDTASTPAYTTPGNPVQAQDTAANTSTDTAAMKMTPPTSTDTSKKKLTSGTASKKKGSALVKMMLPAPPKNHKVVKDKSDVYEYAEVMPSYRGGTAAIENYVTNNIDYPQNALDNSKEGRILVAFTVDENGKIKDAHLVSSKLGDGLDEEAVRVVSAMPAWTPGTVKGKPVKTRMTLPITFQIEE